MKYQHSDESQLEAVGKKFSCYSLVPLKISKQCSSRAKLLSFVFIFQFSLSMVAGNEFETSIVSHTGSKATLPCSGREHFTNSDLSWRLPGKNLGSSVDRATGNLILREIQLADAGTYVCVADDNIRVATVQLIVKEVPSITDYDSVTTHPFYIQEERNSHRESEQPDRARLQGSQNVAQYGRMLAVTVAVSILAFVTLGSGIALLLMNRRRNHMLLVSPDHESPGEEESLELVPHITLNPSFNIDMLEHCAPDFEQNSEHAFLVGEPSGRER